MPLSLSNKLWKQHDLDEKIVSKIKHQYGISDVLARIIAPRISHIGHNIGDICHFLDPKIKYQMPDPLHLIDMQKAVKRTVKAIISGEQIHIFADYDVDGATSSALLKRVFTELGIKSFIYVPDRIKEGYGPTAYAIDKIKNSGTKLLITVDCGSMAHEAIQYASDNGLDVIVLDHHLSTEELPNAIAIVNPNRLDETGNYSYLAAVGVSFLFSVALVSELKAIDYFKNTKSQAKNTKSQEIKIPNLLNYIDLVALGTVCDVMPLQKLNRAFVHLGLKVLMYRQNLGLNALCKIANIDQKINCYHLGFILGPRINAGGRVGRSDLGARLLSCDNALEADLLSNELDKHNNERKVIEELMYEDAIKQSINQKDSSIIFILSKDWHQGVIGIIAGKIKEQFNKPTIVIAINDNIGKASCRSIPSVDIGAMVMQAKNQGLLISGGGHAMAAGFSVLGENIQDLHIFLKSLVAKSGHTKQTTDFYDLEITTSSLTLDLVKELERLEPFGQGNSEPILKLSNVFVLKADLVGNKHIKMILSPNKDAYGSRAINAIAFNAKNNDKICEVIFSKNPYKLSVIGHVKVNNYNNRESVQFIIKDIIV